MEMEIAIAESYPSFTTIIAVIFMRREDGRKNNLVNVIHVVKTLLGNYSVT